MVGAYEPERLSHSEKKKKKCNYIHSVNRYCSLQVIAINGKFPGPVINVTTNYNVDVNVFNRLDEPFLFTW